MKKRKDSENFPSLTVDENKTDIIDPLKSVDMTEISKKIETTTIKTEKEQKQEAKMDTLEKILKDTNKTDIKKMIEEPNQQLKQKLKKKRTVTKRQDVITHFEKMFDKIKINKNLMQFKNLVILDFENRPSLEEIEPTKPKEPLYKSRKSKNNHNNNNFRKNSNELLQLTKGKMTKYE